MSKKFALKKIQQYICNTEKNKTLLLTFNFYYYESK